MEGLLITVMDIFENIIEFSEPIVDFLSESYSVAGESFTLMDIVFGVGIRAVIGIAIVNFLT